MTDERSQGTQVEQEQLLLGVLVAAGLRDAEAALSDERDILIVRSYWW
jgi:hypothetical protein